MLEGERNDPDSIRYPETSNQQPASLGLGDEVGTHDRGRMRASEFINDLATSGRYHFDTGEFANAANLTDVAARAALRRLRILGRIATPYRGFHVIVPPEHRRMGCLPPDQFIPQLMTHLSLGYYVGSLRVRHD